MESVGGGVRLATLEDVEAVAATVAAAFATDPAWSFFIGPDNPRAMTSLARALLLPRIHRGTAWVTDDCTAVAMWDRRSLDDPAVDDQDRALQEFRTDAGEAIWARLETYDAAVDAAAPAPPDWYLGVLATHPDVQGRGLATAVMRPGIQAADSEGWDCWLETSSLANKAFYAGRGFTDAVAIDIPGGPPTWWLRRRSSPTEIAEIREAERRLARALESPDPTAWVYEYTNDAVFERGGYVVEGRAALLEMASAMQLLSSVSIRPLRTEASPDVATVEFEGSWVSGPPESGSLVEVSGTIMWRKEDDGRWRVSRESLS